MLKFVTLLAVLSGGVAQPVPVDGADRSPFLNQVEAFADAVLGVQPFGFGGAQDLHTMALVLHAQAMAKPPRAAS